MAEYSFDGKRMKDGTGRKLGELDRSVVRLYNASKLGEIQGNNVRDVNGKKVLELDGRNVKDDMGRKVITLDEIQKLIDGVDGITAAAMWHFFVRK